MQHLWTPWRLGYVTSGVDVPGCLFCWMSEAESVQAERERLVLHRARLNLVAINRFPYNNGHLLIAPHAHVAALADARNEQLEEMMRLARTAEAILRQEYRIHGLNLGMNVGEAAGAGVAEHFHLHLVPRWRGDTNFMATTGETRVVPELPERTWERLRPRFDSI